MGRFEDMFGDNQKKKDRVRYDQLIGSGMSPSSALHTINREKNERRESQKHERRETPRQERKEHAPKKKGGVMAALTGQTAQNFYANMGGYGTDIFGRPTTRKSKKKHKKGKGRKGRDIVIHLG